MIHVNHVDSSFHKLSFERTCDKIWKYFWGKMTRKTKEKKGIKS
jgi:hypothetical protein